VIQVFIQNEAGSNQKHYHDEKTLEWKRVVTVSHPYPFPYGFIVDTTAEDGCNVDCFVITKQKLRTGQIVECEPVGLMEQIEDGQSDHNVLAILRDEDVQISEQIEASLTKHVLSCFQHVAGKDMKVGKFLGAEAAEAHIAAHRDPPA
jgi:inorganic pyrophosphatase